MSNSTVASSEYGVTQYKPLSTPEGSNGGIYNSGLVNGQNSAASQNALINATKGGKKKQYKGKKLNGGAGQIAVPAVPVAYNDGGATQNNVAKLTIVSATQNAQASYDNDVIKGGRRTRHKRNKSKGKKGNRNRNKTKRRISRRHR